MRVAGLMCGDIKGSAIRLLSRNFAKTWHGRPARALGTAKMAVAHRAKVEISPVGFSAYDAEGGGVLANGLPGLGARNRP